MKFLKRFSVVLLILSTAAFALYNGFDRFVKDKTPPQISFDTDNISVSVVSGEEELLSGVTATDDKSGDVSNTLVVQSISDFAEDGSRTVTYAAVDSEKNDGHASRTVYYADYSAPVFGLSGPLVFEYGETIDVASKITAASTLDGDLTGNVKYSFSVKPDKKEPGDYPVTFSVTDSTGYTVTLDTFVTVLDKGQRVMENGLSSYLVYIPVGAEFYSSSYYVYGMQEDGTLSSETSEVSISSGVDLYSPGIYNSDFSLGNEVTRLLVVVQ